MPKGENDIWKVVAEDGSCASNCAIISRNFPVREPLRQTVLNFQPREAQAFYVATPLGFEPRITPPKGAVLPLHHGVISIRDFRLAIFD
jgi:hypothetical protein